MTEATAEFDIQEQRARIRRTIDEPEKFASEQRTLSAEQQKLTIEQSRLLAEALKMTRDRDLAPWQIIVSTIAPTAVPIGRRGFGQVVRLGFPREQPLRFTGGSKEADGGAVEAVLPVGALSAHVPRVERSPLMASASRACRSGRSRWIVVLKRSYSPRTSQSFDARSRRVTNP